MVMGSEEFLSIGNVIFEGQRSVKSLSKSASRLLLVYGGKFFILIGEEEVR